MTSKYNSPFSVGKRQTIFIDQNDPRVRGWKAGITLARAGAEVKIVNSNTLSDSGLFAYLKGSSPTTIVEKGFNPTDTTKFVQPSGITNLDANWSGENFVITFDYDFSNAKNKYVSEFRYRLRTTSYTPFTFEISTVLNKSAILQTITFTEKNNQSVFGEFAPEFSLLEVYAYDSFGNVSDVATLNVSGKVYSSDLPAPVLQANAITSGYLIDWTEISESYANILLEEVVSNANTAPSSGYTSVYFDRIKPAKIITGNTNKRWVRGKFAKSNGILGPLSNAISVTPLSPVTVDNTAPDAPASGNVIAGIDYDPTSSEVVGFNAYIDISWTGVDDNTLRGYRIRFKDNASTGPYSYVDSPGTGTTYRLTGLSIGTTYVVAIASYDEFNNTSSAYTSLGTAVATGTPFIGKNVETTGYFEAFPGGGSTANAFRFGYGIETGKRGLRFNDNNYWYIDSSASATFKLGGNTSNYISWDGSQFIIQGDLRAQKGQFDGNVEIKSGGSLYSGTLNQFGSLSGAGFIINNTGLTFSSATVSDITTINGSTGLFTTTFAKIGGWDIGASYPNTIYSISGNNIIRIDSSNGSIAVNGTGYTSGIGRPDANDIVFWAGSDRSTSSPFYVTKQGFLKSNNADITGVISVGASDMKFGDNVAPITGRSGLHINSTNYWYSNGDFKVGDSVRYIEWDNDTDTLSIKGDLEFDANNYWKLSDGTFKIGNAISATPTSVTIGGNTIIKGGEITLESTGTVETDNNNSAGDPTLILNSSNKITKGRRFIFNANPTTTPPPNATSWDPVTNTGKYFHSNLGNLDVKTGDILMVL